MRELKFDIIFWDGENKETIEHCTAQEALCEDYIEFKDGVLVPTDECTIIRQYTGLLDKQGKEIYEADRVKQFGNPNPFIVEYKDSAWRLGQWILGIDIKTESLKVIGNVYEP